MFGSKSKSQVNTTNEVTTPNHAATPQNSCVIAQGTVIEGVISTTEDIRVDGKIIGDVNCQKRFVMGETGEIDGKVICDESSIKGTIEGTISVKGLLHLLSTAMIKGKIIAKKMIVDEGAAYSGECLIGEEHFAAK